MEYEVMPPIDDGPEPFLDGVCSDAFCPGMDAACPTINPLCFLNAGCNCKHDTQCGGGGGGSW